MINLILAALLVFTVVIIGCKKMPAAKTTAPAGVNAMAKDNLKDADENKIRAMLAALKNGPAPAPRQVMHAMCYEISAPPQYYAFVCPIDGEKTLYADYGEQIKAREASYLPDNNIERLNKAAKGKDITFEIDITQFCKKHYPDLETRSAILSVIYKDGRVVKNPVSARDISLLEAFLNGDKYYGEDELPLQSRLNEIAKLLGQDTNAI